jgi:hypothetical protein
MRTISNTKARELFYAWHSGQASMFYQVASSGLYPLNSDSVSFVVYTIRNEILDTVDNEKERNQLVMWLKYNTQAEDGYLKMPWAK